MKRENNMANLKNLAQRALDSNLPIVLTIAFSAGVLWAQVASVRTEVTEVAQRNDESLARIENIAARLTAIEERAAENQRMVLVLMQRALEAD